MRILSALLILIFTASPLQAADPVTQGTAAVAEPPQYEIELLVFLRDAAPGGEYWPEVEQRPDPALAIATVQGDAPPEFLPEQRMTAFAAASPPASAGRSGTLVTPLDHDSYQLQAHAEAMRRKGMTPLVHAAWRQVVGDRNNKDWLWLEGGPIYGLVRISVERYLHIDTDLLLMAPDQGQMPPHAIRAQDHRRMRSGELHYIDHPAFGILVQINRYEPPKAITGATGQAGAEPLTLESIATEPQLPSEPPSPAGR